MSEEIVIENCSPTLAGLKTGNMFSIPAFLLCGFHRFFRGICMQRRMYISVKE